MMLQALCAYAEREGLGDLDFEKRPVDYQLRLDVDGTFLGLVALATGRVRAVLDRLPLGPPSKNNPGYPCFVVDNATYILGTPKDGGDPQKKRENADKCHKSYCALIGEAADKLEDEGLRALNEFLKKAGEVFKADAALQQQEAKTPEKRGERVLVPVLESDDSRIHERPAVRAWWTSTRDLKRAQQAEAQLGRCLVTGVLAPIARIHHPLKGPPFPGTGAKLVAYDKDPYMSQRLEQGANASVSELAAQRYVAALNHLLEREGDRRRAAVLLDDKTVVVFWTRDRSEASRLLLSLFDPVPKARHAAESVEDLWRGVRPVTFDPTPFYAVTLSANNARVVIRDWFETSAGAVADNLKHWFTDLQLSHGEPEPMPLVPMLRALQATPTARGDKRGLSPGLATQLFRAAVQGAPLPRSLLAAALDRVRLPPREKQKREDALFDQRARFGIIKAVLRRFGRKDIHVALDESNASAPYLLGRLFAVLERLQALAQGNVNATIRDRYFGAASRTPASVFPRLLDLSQHHLKKLGTEKKGLAVNLDKVLGEIFTKIAPPFPATLRLEEQGEFAIGYYHQREARKPQPGAPTTDAVPQENAS
jgi:CRISPR-associated protein Csd1